MKQKHELSNIEEVDKVIEEIISATNEMIEKYPAFEKWLMRESQGDKDILWLLLFKELMRENEIVFEWLDKKAGNLKTNLTKISEAIIKRNQTNAKR